MYASGKRKEIWPRHLKLFEKELSFSLPLKTNEHTEIRIIEIPVDIDLIEKFVYFPSSVGVTKKKR